MHNLFQLQVIVSMVLPKIEDDGRSEMKSYKVMPRSQVWIGDCNDWNVAAVSPQLRFTILVDSVSLLISSFFFHNFIFMTQILTSTNHQGYISAVTSRLCGPTHGTSSATVSFKCLTWVFLEESHFSSTFSAMIYASLVAPGPGRKWCLVSSHPCCSDAGRFLQ